ncbi:ATP-binding protein [Aquihabitans sp. McL0605]|uniref:ATP-binding protein n=1 Tax=Aquihabitans sp. McL0605 TaxID=3415671 RepID=UPI003CE8D657
MSLTCETCGRISPEGDAFCPGCGTRLPAAAPSPARALAGERRQLTLLFYDLVGSTEISTRVDTEDLQLVMARYQDMCGRMVRDVGGYAANTMGDGGLVYFGYPEAQEDDPFRAVLAAQAMLDELPVLNDALHADFPSFTDELQMRIGIHSGMVVLGEEGSDLGSGRLAIGEALNMASRIETAAPVNGIAVSDVTARRVHGVVDLTSLGLVQLKGIDGPVELHRVERIRPGQSRFTSAQAIGPFVGREGELARLEAGWAGAQAGRAAMVVLSADAGLGKSRLHNHLRRGLGSTVHTWFELYGSAVMGQSAFHPIIQVIQQVLELDGRTVAEQRTRLVDALALVGLDAPDLISHLAHLVGVEDDADAGTVNADGTTADGRRRAVIDAICTWWLAIADRLPTVIVAEDLHWFDPSTLEVLRELWRRAEGHALLIIGTTRPGTDITWDDRVEVIDLEPLAFEAVTSLVERLAEDGELSPVQLTQIAARSDGVPLFAEELVQAALDAGGNVDAVPETLRELMSSRLDRLGPAKEALQLAALLGREFPRNHLAAVAEVADLDVILDVLIEQRFIVRRVAGDQPRFLFRHALLQDAARDSMLRRRREAEHRRIAQLLIDEFAGTRDARPEIIGHHYAEGAEPALAVEQFRLAGHEAIGRAALREGAAHLTRSIEVLAEVDPSEDHDQLEIELHLQLGSALALSDGMRSPRATEVHERAVELCRRTDPRNHRYGQALNGVLQSHVTAGRFDDALATGEEQLRWATETGSRTAQLSAHAALCQVHFWPGRYGSCWEHATRAWELYDPSDPIEERQAVGIDSGLTALTFAAVGAWALGHLGESRDLADRALELAKAQDDVYQVAFTAAYLSMHAIMLNEAERCRALALEGQELAIRHGFLPMQGLTTYTLGWALAELGDPAGLDVAREGVNQLAGMGVGIGAPGCMAVLAEMCAKDGAIEEGFGYAALGEAMAADLAQDFYTAEIHRSVALLQLATADAADAADDPEAADAALAAADAAADAGIAMARAQRAPSLELRAVQPKLTLLHRRGEHHAARDLLAEVVDRFPPDSHGVDLDRSRADLDDPARWTAPVTSPR